MHSFLVLCSCLVLFLDDQRGRDPAAPPSLSSVLVFHVERLRSSLFILLIPIIIFIFTLFLTLIRETLGRETREIIPFFFFPQRLSLCFHTNPYERERESLQHIIYFSGWETSSCLFVSLFTLSFVIISCYIILLWSFCCSLLYKIFLMTFFLFYPLEHFSLLFIIFSLRLFFKRSLSKNILSLSMKQLGNLFLLLPVLYLLVLVSR